MPECRFCMRCLPYFPAAYTDIASLGHCETHAPHSVQSSPITALPSLILIAPTEHASTHISQPVHLSKSTFAAILVVSTISLFARYPAFLPRHQAARSGGESLPPRSSRALGRVFARRFKSSKSIPPKSGIFLAPFGSCCPHLPILRPVPGPLPCGPVPSPYGMSVLLWMS